jgi:hypothetical protein
MENVYVSVGRAYNADIKLISILPCLFGTPPPPIAICDVVITRLIMLEAAIKNNFQFCLKAIVVHKIPFSIVL